MLMTISRVVIPEITIRLSRIGVDWKRILHAILSIVEPLLVLVGEEAGLGPAAPLVVGGALSLTRRSLLG
jgi:hypothetical protein